MTEAPDIRPRIVASEAEEASVDKALDRSLAPGGAADWQTDAFISGRHRDRVEDNGGREDEAAWNESSRRAEATRRAENSRAWASYHRDQIGRHTAVLGALVAHHAAEAERHEANANRKEPAP